jgi:hypothetical protein
VLSLPGVLSGGTQRHQSHVTAFRALDHQNQLVKDLKKQTSRVLLARAEVRKETIKRA